MARGRKPKDPEAAEAKRSETEAQKAALAEATGSGFGRVEATSTLREHKRIQPFLPAAGELIALSQQAATRREGWGDKTFPDVKTCKAFVSGVRAALRSRGYNLTVETFEQGDGTVYAQFKATEPRKAREGTQEESPEYADV